MIKQHIYILSGLGADERMFKHFHFPENYIVHHVKWIEPLKSNEQVRTYVIRLLEQISTPRPIIIGLSFGGLVACEIMKLIYIDKLILISSFKTKHEVPWYFRALGIFRLHRIVPTRLFKQSSTLTNWFFGVSSKEHQLLLKDILKQTDPKFLRWAINVILTWDNEFVLDKKTIHIHGSKDRLIPFGEVDAMYKIEDGGHLMVLDKANEINGIILNLLKNDHSTKQV